SYEDAGHEGWHIWPAKEMDVTWKADGGTAQLDYVMGKISMGDVAQQWDEFSTAHYALKVALTADGAQSEDEKSTTFGFRHPAANARKFTLPGHPIMFRGTLECAVFPITGYPPTTGPEARQFWDKLFLQVRLSGLNHVRFHSWCPPEVAFDSADRLGIYL